MDSIQESSVTQGISQRDQVQFEIDLSRERNTRTLEKLLNPNILCFDWEVLLQTSKILMDSVMRDGVAEFLTLRLRDNERRPEHCERYRSPLMVNGEFCIDWENRSSATPLDSRDNFNRIMLGGPPKLDLVNLCNKCDSRSD